MNVILSSKDAIKEEDGSVSYPIGKALGLFSWMQEQLGYDLAAEWRTQNVKDLEGAMIVLSGSKVMTAASDDLKHGLCILSRLVEKVTSRNLRLRELVTFFDEDGNGSIDHDEFMEGAKKLGLMDVTDDDADSCMRAMGMVDGEVESANLINTYKKYMLKVPMKNCLEIFFALWMEDDLKNQLYLGQLFTLYDVDGNEVLSDSEFRVLCSDELKLPPKELQDLFDSDDYKKHHKHHPESGETGLDWPSLRSLMYSKGLTRHLRLKAQKSQLAAVLTSFANPSQFVELHSESADPEEGPMTGLAHMRSKLMRPKIAISRELC